MYKANIANGRVFMEKVLGYVENDGDLTIASCGIYPRKLGAPDRNGGVFHDGAAYAPTKEKALACLLGIAQDQVNRKKAELACAKFEEDIVRKAIEAA